MQDIIVLLIVISTLILVGICVHLYIRKEKSELQPEKKLQPEKTTRMVYSSGALNRRT